LFRLFGSNVNPVLTRAQNHTNVIQETNQVKYKLKTSDKCGKIVEMWKK